MSVLVRPPRRRGRRGAAGEDAYRARRVRGTTYFTSRQEHDDLTIVVERFPGPAGEPGLVTPPPSAGAPRPSRPTFVLVHGIGVSSRYYHPLAVQLAGIGAVYLVDLPGYGAAPNPRRDVPLADHAAVLAAFLRATGISNPVLVGHSWGCQVVAALAEEHPDVSDRIVLMAPTMEPVARTPLRAAGRLFLDGFREPFGVFLIAASDYLVRCGIPYLLRQVPHMLDDRIEDRVGAHGSRVLVVTGDRDPIASRDWGRALAARARRGVHHEVEGPHVVMHSQPERIAREIREFVA